MGLEECDLTAMRIEELSMLVMDERELDAPNAGHEATKPKRHLLKPPSGLHRSRGAKMAHTARMSIRVRKTTQRLEASVKGGKDGNNNPNHAATTAMIRKLKHLQRELDSTLS